MAKRSTHKAVIPNPALAPLNPLLGEWKTAGTHPLFPDTILYGHSSFEWMEGGAFLIWHSQIDKEGFPSGVAIFGSDEANGDYFMLYFDERKVSRQYQVSIEENKVKWWRNAPGFSQRYTWILAEDGNTMIGKGELSKDGKSWEADLELTYTRIQ